MTRGPVHEARPLLRNPAPPRLSAVAPRIQRLCRHGARAGDECAKCATVQRKERNGAPGRRQAPEVEAVLANPGRPLPPAVRQDMEARFGQDFGAVRIHDDAAGARAAEAVDAEAFAYGNDIAFAAGRFNPESPAGRELLAHELAHTVQQSRGAAEVARGGAASAGALEREADAAAAAAIAYAPVPRLSAAPAAVARATPSTQPTPTPSPTFTIDGRSYHVTVLGGGAKQVAALASPVVEVSITPLYVPKAKGDRALKLLGSFPPSPVYEVKGSKASGVTVKQDRELTTPLQAHWLERVGWAAPDVSANWIACGGDADFPKIGGGGNRENIQLLDGGPNTSSGGLFKGQLAKLAEAIVTDPTLGLLGNQGSLTLHMKFKGVDTYGDAPSSTKCYEAESKAIAGTGTKKTPGAPQYKVRLHSGDVGLVVDAKKAVDKFDGDNAHARLAYAGLILTKLKAPAKNVHQLEASIDTATSRLPITVKSQPGVPDAILLVEPASDTAKVPTLKKGSTNLPVELLFLSPGKITEIKNEDGKTSWAGEINPTPKFLPTLKIAYAEQKLSISTELNTAAFAKKYPIPGAKVTHASLSIELMPEFKPSGNLDFEYSPGGKKLADAKIKVFPEGGTLAADGDLNLFIGGQTIPGWVKYRLGDASPWSMGATVKGTDLKLPFVQSGELTVAYAKSKFSAVGTLALALPGGSGQLTLSYADGSWLFSGSGQMVHQPFGTVEVTLKDDGDLFTATGTVTMGLSKLGLTPKVRATFKKKHGEENFRVSGSGSVDIARDKLNGTLNVTLHESGAVTGEGKLKYTIREGLIAELGVVMDKDQKVTTTGTAKLTKPIDLFKAKGGKYELTLLKLTIPIPGVSAGPVGLKFSIGCGIDAGYFFGPAQLKDVEVGGELKPFAPDPDPKLDLKGTLSIDAGASLGFWIKGSLILDALIVSATGSIKISAAAVAKGNASLLTSVHYEKGWFAITAYAEASASLDLKFGVYASVEVDSVLGGKRWDWTLSEFFVPTGLKFSFGAPISYHSQNGLTLPSADKIVWKPPQSIDAGTLLKNFITAARKSGPPE